MSAFGEPGDIVEAMAFGADDFLPKPFDLDLFQANPGTPPGPHGGPEPRSPGAMGGSLPPA